MCEYALFIVFRYRIWRPGIEDLLLRPAEPKWPPTSDVIRSFAYLIPIDMPIAIPLAGGSILSVLLVSRGKGWKRGINKNRVSRRILSHWHWCFRLVDSSCWAFNSSIVIYLSSLEIIDSTVCESCLALIIYQAKEVYNQDSRKCFELLLKLVKGSKFKSMWTR